MVNPYLEYGGSPTYGLPLFGWPRFGIPGAVHAEEGGARYTWLNYEAEQYQRHLEFLKQQDREFEELLKALIESGVI